MHQNELLRIIEEMYAARRNEDVDQSLDYFSEDAVFRIEGKSLGPIAEAISGKQALREMFSALFATWDWKDYPIERILVDGQNVAVYCKGYMHNTEHNKDVYIETLDLLVFNEGGKITEFIEFLDTKLLSQYL